MLRLLLLNLSLVFCLQSFGTSIKVTNAQEVELANKNAKPGDTIILKNGNWNNITLKINCKGEKEHPIVFKAETKGKVFITGKSNLQLGGNYIVIDGLYFTNGSAEKEDVIKFSINQDQIANNCRVTNTVINDFNSTNRLDENYWVAFYGKNNRIDHCTFLNKKNLGVLLAVILEDDRSRENFHSIDHNYFGFRTPLASNAGEIIRIGVAEHCEYNSNTIVTDNFFEKCDGEAEVISVKSGKNIVHNNLFTECQGAVVLRHGNYNTVTNNIFLGNGKKGTGGVRVINKGHLIVNNYFYKCMGVDFRSPLAIMNGVPNSPAKRYVGVSDSKITNNSFYNCAPISFCEGSNAERSLQPKNVEFANNLFYNNSDTAIYHVYDDISGIQFSNNAVSREIKSSSIKGFSNNTILTEVIEGVVIPKLSSGAGYIAKDNFKNVLHNAYHNCGASWFTYKPINQKIININCSNVAEILKNIFQNNNNKLIIHLTKNSYQFTGIIKINKDVEFINDSKNVIKFESANTLPYLFEIKGNHKLELKNLSLDLTSLNAKVFITSDISGTSNHSNFIMQNCKIQNFNGDFFKAAKSSLLDSIIVNNCSWSNGKGLLFNLNEETDRKGYYNVEKLSMSNNSILNHSGPVLAILRSGIDESTLGPLVEIVNNKFISITYDASPLILLNGVQLSFIKNNTFSNCNSSSKVIEYKDEVRAAHLLSNNNFDKSGVIVKNEYVINKY